MQLSELKTYHVSKLLEMAAEAGVDNANRMRKQELVFAVLKAKAKNGETIIALNGTTYTLTEDDMVIADEK